MRVRRGGWLASISAQIVLDRRCEDLPHGECGQHHQADRQQLPAGPPGEVGVEPGERPHIPGLQHGQPGQDIDDGAAEPGQDRDIAVGALLQCRKFRLELRRDGKTAPAQAVDRVDHKPGGDDDDDAHDGGAQHIEEAALDMQRVDRVDPDDVENCQQRPDLGDGAADPAPAGCRIAVAGDPGGDRRLVLQQKDRGEERQHQPGQFEQQGVERTGNAEPPGGLGHGVTVDAPEGEALDPDIEVVAGLGVDRHEQGAVIGGQQHGAGQAQDQAGLDRRIDQHRQGDAGRGQGIERHRHRAVGDRREDQDRHQVKHQPQQGEQTAHRVRVPPAHREFWPRPGQHPAQRPLGRAGKAEDENEGIGGLDPALPRRGVGDLLTRPADQARRIDDDRRPGQDLAGERVDLLRQLPEQGDPGGPWGRDVALDGDQRPQFLDEICSRRIVLQGVDQALQFVDRNRRRRGSRLCRRSRRRLRRRRQRGR